jgi:hypothetical protein
VEAVRQIIDSNLLSGVIPLPKDFQNKNVEVIVFLKEEKAILPSLTKGDIDAMLKDSVTESLIGALPHSDISIEEYRSERLRKYECAD